MARRETLREGNDFDDALNWLNVVGRWENRRIGPTSDFHPRVDETLFHLAGLIAEGYSEVAALLADLDRQAEEAISPRPDLHSDYGEQILRRRDQLYALTRL